MVTPYEDYMAISSKCLNTVVCCLIPAALPTDSIAEFSQFQTPQYHLGLPALRDFILDFVPAPWHSSNFTLSDGF